MQDKLIFHYPRVHLNNRAWPLLFPQLDKTAIDDIRLALNQNQPLGNKRFYAKIRLSR